MEHILTSVIFLPLLGALFALFANERIAKWICTVCAGLTFLVSVPLATNYSSEQTVSLDRYYEKAILPRIFEAHSIGQSEGDAYRTSALERLNAEKVAIAAVMRQEAGIATPAEVAAAETRRTQATKRFDDTFGVRVDARGIEDGNDVKVTRYKDFAREAGDLADAAANPTARSMKFVEHAPWIPSFRINYIIGVDGLSLPLVLLTTLLTFLCLVYSWRFDADKPVEQRRPLKAFYILFLLLETGLVGVFSSLDFFLFYVFWELVLLPSYFLIGIWGGENRNYAAIKFFIYTLVGSVAMLVAMLALYFKFEPHTFNILAITELTRRFGGTSLFSSNYQFVIFFLLFLGFAVKVPIFPFHTWLPDAHVQAPTAFSVMLAGVMLKMGGYGFFRFSFPMCHNAALTHAMIWALGILGMVNIVYGALVAMGQTDFKSLVAYSSVSHMGYVVLGMATATAAGMEGGALQMVNHGISSAGMFFIVGIIYDRAHHRDLNRFGGIALQMPKYFGLSLVILFASLGLPGLNGFISEAFVFLGAWQSTILPRWITLVSMAGIVLGAAYILWTIRRVFLGPLTDDHYKHFPDLEARELFALVPLAILCVVVGVFPDTVLHGLGLSDAIRDLTAALGIPGLS